MHHASTAFRTLCGTTFIAIASASPLAAQALTLSGGAGMLGATREGYVTQVGLTYDAPLRGATRWWGGVHAGRDPNPGWSSPGIRQSVSEVVVSAGPLLPIRVSQRHTAFVGAGAYGVFRRFGAARIENSGPVPETAGTIGGDWGGIGRAGMEFGLAPRWGLVVESQLRLAVEGSERRRQPGFSAGVRHRW